MRYIIELNPNFVYGEFLRIPIRLAGEDQWIKTKASITPYTEPDRKAIEDEVWSFVNFLENKLMASDYDGIFDDNSPYDHMTYQEAKAKYDEWLKQKDEINFGDEIISVEDDVKAVMLDCADNESIHVLTENGCVERWKDLDGVKKTGRHFPEVAKMLKKMRGEEE